jgi:putative MATE family efflux protein
MAAPTPARPADDTLDPRTRMLLQAPVVPLMLRMAWPNVIVMVTQAAAGLMETWFIGRLGTDALAGMALVFPGVMLMQMLSAGALGGAISSAVARALGAGRRADANALVLHALVINAVLALAITFVMLAFGREIYTALGGRDASLEAALAYSNAVFLGNIFLWLMNGLASVIRGSGNMLTPALVILAGALLLAPVSAALIFGFGPVPALGVAGGALAFVLFNLGGMIALGWYVLSGRNVAHFVWTRLHGAMFTDILRVGAVGIVSTIQTNATIIAATALVAAYAGPAAVAGYGTGARLEYLMVPLVFGFGAPLVALVGSNVGAGRRDRALHIAWVGAAFSFAICEIIGVAAALFPQAWLRLFDSDPTMVETGALYLRCVGPFYGFFGAGLALYFASQGAGRLLWPLAAGFVRMVVAIVGGWLALRATGSLTLFFLTIGAALALYGLLIALAIWRGVWFRGR